MRGGPLSDSEVVEALQPYVVTYWAQKDRAAPPPEIQALYDKADRRMGSNVTCFVVDSRGKLLHSFNGFPNGEKNPTGISMKEIARYFVAEIAKAGAEAPARTNRLTLPDIADGVRLFVRLDGEKLFESYRSPVLEVVADDGEWKTLARSASVREIDASKLARWLRLCYPPGINEQLKPYGEVAGTLTLKPQADGTAILAGKVRMTSGDISFEGTFQAVITYEEDQLSLLRGVVEGTYPRHDKSRRRKSDLKLVAAIESRIPPRSP